MKKKIAFIFVNIIVTEIFILLACTVFRESYMRFWETLGHLDESFQYLWCMLTGIAAACVTAWLNLYIDTGNRVKRAMILGCLLFGADLLLFNFFMPLVFDADIPDLILRSLIDILAATLGCLSFPNKRTVSTL